MTQEERIAKLESDVGHLSHELTEVKEDVKDIKNLTASIEVLTNQMKNANESIKAMRTDIADIKGKPNTYLNYIISALVSGVICSICGIIIPNLIR